MQFKFKKHQRVKILVSPDAEYVEYHTENSNVKDSKIIPGMKGKINVILPNGKYHVEILDDNEKEFAYAPFDEDQLESID